MIKSTNRRNFLKASAAIALTSGANIAIAATGDTVQEHYEIRTYKVTNPTKKTILDRYLENALIPALSRIGIDRIGVFTNRDDVEDHSVYMLIPYSKIETFVGITPALEADKAYQDAAKEYYSEPLEDPIYSRINSKLFKAFSGMPTLGVPKQSTSKAPRIFELRTYEGHNEEKSALKIEMFNIGEIQVMQQAGLAPVFFGQAIIGDDVPNLTYMLSATDQEDHQSHWDAFRVHEGWLKIKDLPRYKGSISNITSTFLVPTSYSQL
ncbi:MAG: twin-arginine translocation signal domain-containing protein [Kordiimonadaceae bacterium]|jgi:hypothetical protein|nr:twin-arginine translocation signal domain-containing protein [Kordiimonadaceae bacterium]MBT6032026.1 twin-arginine translocation signal domain-containing protein [Kordiimonadaceae bacterium]